MSASNNSINCSFVTRTFWPAYRRYSSNIDAKFHLCSLRRHPTTVPVRCLPRLHINNRGKFCRSSTNSKAANTMSSVNGSLFLGYLLASLIKKTYQAFTKDDTPKWCSVMFWSSTKSKLPTTLSSNIEEEYTKMEMVLPMPTKPPSSIPVFPRRDSSARWDGLTCTHLPRPFQSSIPSLLSSSLYSVRVGVTWGGM